LRTAQADRCVIGTGTIQDKQLGQHPFQLTRVNIAAAGQITTV